MKKKKYTLPKKLRYELDDFVSKGFWNQVLLLFACGLIIVFICGFIVMLLFTDKGLGWSLWQSLMHLIDQGTITADSTDDKHLIFIMLLITFLGMAFTSTIIGIVGNGIEEKIGEMKKGHSAVVEKNHTVILGFNDNTHTIIDEIMECNNSRGVSGNVVIVDNLPKEEMEHTAKEVGWGHLRYDDDEKDTAKKERRITTIFRSGDLLSENTYPMCALDRARNVIINGGDDFETIQILLSVVSYLKANNAYIGSEKMPSIAAVIYDYRNLSAAEIATETIDNKNDKVKILYSKELISKVFALACVQPENVQTIINAFDDNDHSNELAFAEMMKTIENTKEKRNYLIIGWSKDFAKYLDRLKAYNDESFSTESIQNDSYSWEEIRERLETNKEWLDSTNDKHLTNIIIISNDEIDKDESDKNVMLLLLNLRDYLKKNCGYTINITTEINRPQNQMLIQGKTHNDIVITTQIANRFLVQAMENPEGFALFENIMN